MYKVKTKAACRHNKTAFLIYLLYKTMRFDRKEAMCVCVLHLLNVPLLMKPVGHRDLPGRKVKRNDRTIL